MSDAVAEIQARIAKNKAELAELEEGIKDYHAEDFRKKFEMDIENLKKSIEKDETLLEGAKNE